MPELIPPPPPGLYYDVPFEVYASWDAANCSRLKDMAGSPASCRWRLDNPPQPTADFLLGQAVHSLVLEPDRYHERYAAAPDVDRRTKAGKAAWAEFQASTEESCRTVLTADQAAHAAVLAEAAAGHPLAGRLLSLPGASEVSFVWRDEETGLTCKGRADRLTGLPGGLLASIDLKTAEDASPGGFARALETYRYHWQAGFYRTGLHAIGEPYEAFAFVAVEKSPPYLVGVYQLDAEDVEAGWQAVRPHLARYARCLGSSLWPGYCFDEETGHYLIERISRPAWAKGR